MGQLTSLPTLSVQIAFNPTNLQSLTQTWTDVTAYTQDFTTNSGRQHFLDRIEASTIRITFNNRNGFFLNGTTNGSGSVIRSRLPIKVSATVSGTSYPIFWGLIESAEEQTLDQLNQELIVTASDQLKYLSLLYMNRPNFYAQYVNSTYDQNHYTLGKTGVSDLLLGNTGSIIGAVSTTQQGALLYSTDTCLDLTNGGSSTNVASFQPYGSSQLNTGSIGSIDLWFIGNQTAGQTIFTASPSAGVSYNINVSPTGELIAQAQAVNAVTIYSGVLVNDGNWHHVGITNYTTGGLTYLYLYCDGAYTLISSFSGTQTVSIISIGGNYVLSAYIYEVVIGKAGQTANNPNILNRWAAGKLLSRTKASGDRIAEILVLSGLGTISSGALTVPNYTVKDLPWNQSAAITSISGTGTTATATLASNPWTAGQSVFISGNTYSGSIANISWAAGIATVTMTAAHAYTVGTAVTISGASIAAYNGTWAVQSVGSTTWTFVSAYSSTPGLGTDGATSGPSYYNGLFTVTTATSTTFAFSSTGTATITGGTASVNSTSTFSVQALQSPVTGSTALDLIQQVTDTDIGAFFQNPDGTFEFDNQAYLYSAANNVTPTGAYVWTDGGVSSATFYDANSLSILRDDADVWTTVQITAQNGTIQTYENTAAEPLYAYSTLTKTNVISVTNEQAMQSAIYLGNLYQSPLPRVQNVELSSKTNNGYNLAQMLNHYLNDAVQFVRSQNGASLAGQVNATMVVESIRHDFKADPGEWTSSFTFDPYPKRFQNTAPPTFFMLFDDATYGMFDSTNNYL
jgi:hypothetical protein